MEVAHTHPTAHGVIFDGDDTLWLTEPLYDEARANARSIVAGVYLDGSEWETLQRRIDIENVAVLGFSPERFPTSCVQAYQALCELRGLHYDESVAAKIRTAAQEVFRRDPELVPGALRTLRELRAAGIRLALLTKGDFDIQRRRVSASGLENEFDLVRIVAEKAAETIRAVAAELGVPLANAWMVGNSIRSDVLPALEAGIRAIWIEAHVWEYERAHDHLLDARVIVVPELPVAVGEIMRETAIAGRRT